MACPKCGCKVHYQYDGGAGWDNHHRDDCDEALQRCAACGHVFELEDAAEDDDDC